MKCSCCGRKKRFFESFEELSDKVKICVECSKILYKYQDAVKEKKEDTAQEYLSRIQSKKNSVEFQEWIEKFIQRIRKDETKKHNQIEKGEA